MALITCRECQREISDLAVSCPGCGSPRLDTSMANLPGQTQVSMLPSQKNGIIAVVIGTALVGAGYYYAGPHLPWWGWLLVWGILVGGLSNQLDRQDAYRNLADRR